MHINTTLLTCNHSKSVVAQLKNSDSLPFSEVLSAECIANTFQDIDYRERIFTPDIIIWGFLSQVLSHDKSCQATIARIIAFFVTQGKKPPSANTAAYSKARSRLPEEIISNLAKENAKQLQEQISPAWCWRKRHIKLVDGTTLFMPDTEENQMAYPQSKSQKPGLGFPIAQVVAVMSYVTGAVLDLAIGPCVGKETGEHALLRQIMHVFQAGDIVLGDCYYASFFFMATLMRLGIDAVMPIHHARHYDFRKGMRLGKKDHIVEWKKPKQPEWMSLDDYMLFPNEIPVREAEVCSSRKGFKSHARIIATTFLDVTCVSKNDLKNMYDYRWCIELDLKSIKDTMHMGILRGKTPNIIRKEIWMHILAYNLVRKIMTQAATIYNKIPRELSFNLALQVIDAFRQSGIFSENKKEAYMQLLKAITCKTIGNRPNRNEPRRLKRRPKNYPLLLKPRWHYHQEVA